MERYNAGVYTECVQPIVEAGLADLVEEGICIADCLTLIEAAGHTIGHMAGLLESGGEGTVLAGDAIHHPSNVCPNGPMQAFDDQQAQITRHNLLDLCGEKRLLGLRPLTSGRRIFARSARAAGNLGWNGLKMRPAARIDLTSFPHIRSASCRS